MKKSTHVTDNQSKSIKPTQCGGSPAASEVDSFLADLRQRRRSIVDKLVARGRLIFALDATASRQPTWDTACQLQADMFREAAAVGSLSVQLVYYRGDDECRASRWVSQAERLGTLMGRINCVVGYTQIGRVLQHARRESEREKATALIFIGDAVEENPDELAHKAGELGCLGVPVFVFQEGDDRKVEQVFREIARLTRGAYCRFDAGAADQLRELLRAVAVFATGGTAALAARKDAGSIKLLGQLR